MATRKPEDVEVLSIDGREVRITHPAKLYFSAGTKLSKLDLVRYYLSVAPGALKGIRNRPIVLKRFVNGAEGEAFYQKRAPSDRPSWLNTVILSFPSGRTAEELVVNDAAGLAWIVNLGCIELHPHPVRASDLDHPDELRIDLDPGPGVPWADVSKVALEVKTLLDELGLRGWPKTSGSRGMHVNVRIEPRWSFTEVRRAALALSREIERRAPMLASSKWWKEERHGVFLDYNQNAKDRTTASAYSVRPLPDARVSAPLHWNEVADANPADFTVLTMPQRFADLGDPHADMDQTADSLDPLLDLAARDEASGLGDAPWPPHFRKMEGEASRVQPSKARSAPKAFSDQIGEGFGSQRFRKRAQTAARQPATATEGTGETNAGAEDPAASAPIVQPQSHPASSQNGSSEPQVKSRKTPVKRTARFPLLTISNSPHEDAALAGLERWKAAHPEAAAHLAVDDILTDRMRGRSSTWTRIRINLRHVPEELRPPQQTPDPDDDPTRSSRIRRSAGKAGEV